MAYSRITHTSDGIGAIKYAKDGSAHNTDKFVKGRVLFSSSLNCTVNGCESQMMSVWKHYGVDRATRRKLEKKPRREAQRLIQSFDPEQLDYRNLDDIRTANRIGLATAKKIYPNQQSIVITQADGVGHKLHNHIITNMINYKTGKALHGKKTGWQYTAKVTDDITRQFHNSQDVQLDPSRHHNFIKTENGRTRYASRNPTTSAEYHISKRNGYSWVADIKARLDKASDISANWHEYIANCKRLGVVCDPFRKSGKLKKRTSYRFIGKDNKLHRIRSKKLGPIYSPDNLSNTVFPTIRKRRADVQRKHSQAQKSASVASSASTKSKSTSTSSAASITDSAKFVSFSNNLSMSYQNAERSYSLSQSAKLAPYKVSPRILLISRMNLEPSADVQNNVNNTMNKLSDEHICQAMPTMSKVYQTEAINHDNDIKEFHVISNGLNFTDEDKSLTERLFGKLRDGLAKAKDKFKQTKVYKEWHKVDDSIHNYIKSHHLKVIFTNDSEGYLIKNPLTLTTLARLKKPRKIESHIAVPSKIHFKKRKKAINYNVDVDKQNRRAKAWNRAIISPYQADDMAKLLNTEHDDFITHFNIIARKADDEVIDAQNSVSKANRRRKAFSDEAERRESQATSTSASVLTSFVVNHTSLGSYADSIAYTHGDTYFMGLTKISRDHNILQPNIYSVAWHYADNKSTSLYETSSATSSASASKSASAASSASISASQSAWTSSVANLDYNDWLNVEVSVIDDKLHNGKYYHGNIYHYEKYQDDAIKSIGASKHVKYTGIDDSHNKTRAYYNSSYYQKTVTFSQCDSLTNNDANNSMSDDRKIQSQGSNINHSLSHDKGPKL